MTISRALLRRTIAFSAVIILLVAIFTAINGTLTSADIRVDTGDLRWCYLGIPRIYEAMPDPQRSRLLALGAGSKLINKAWRSCAVFPERSTNHTERMWATFYFNVAIWAEQDPNLARLMLEDLAMALEGRGSDFPRNLLFNRYVEIDEKGHWTVVKDWRQDPAVLEYMARKHYVLPTIGEIKPAIK